MKEVVCPACGALMESSDQDVLVELAKRHTLAAHNYDIPEEHVVAAIEEY
ncbi:hypothetical protein L615_000300000650 [Nocardioides sp. J9]|nr:hypothetical protein L615_000300000650 [Nocardioides sp. J9]